MSFGCEGAAMASDLDLRCGMDDPFDSASGVAMLPASAFGPV